MIIQFLMLLIVVREGIALLDSDLSPYSGDVFHEVSHVCSVCTYNNVCAIVFYMCHSNYSTCTCVSFLSG